MVFHPEAGWGGLPTRVQKTKIYNLETDEFVTDTRHFQKSIWREHFAGLFRAGSLELFKLTLKFEIIFSPGKL